jgi:hypothetical protein
MKFREPHRHNPFDNPLVRLGTHVIALGVACGSVYFAVAEGSWTPLAVGAICVTLMEVTWAYYQLRR